MVSAPNPDERLFPGTTANITITTQSPHGIIVPAEALYFVPDADQLKGYHIERENTSGNRLWIKTEFGLKAVPVTAGASDGVETIILSGINIGDSIVVGTEKTLLKAKAEGASLFPKPPTNGGGGGHQGMIDRKIQALTSSHIKQPH